MSDVGDVHAQLDVHVLRGVLLEIVSSKSVQPLKDCANLCATLSQVTFQWGFTQNGCDRNAMLTTPSLSDTSQTEDISRNPETNFAFVSLALGFLASSPTCERVLFDKVSDVGDVYAQLDIHV